MAEWMRNIVGNAGSPHGADGSRLEHNADAVLEHADAFVRRVRALLTSSEVFRERAGNQHARLRSRTVTEVLWQTPLETLREVSDTPLHLATLRNARVDNVARLLELDQELLLEIPGLGRKTADDITSAATRLAAEVYARTPFRFEPERRDERQTALLRTLSALRLAERTRSEIGPDAHRLAERLGSATERSSGSDGATAARVGAELSGPLALAVQRKLDEFDELARCSNSALWQDFGRDSDSYVRLLDELETDDPPTGAHDGGDVTDPVALVARCKSRGQRHFFVTCPTRALVDWCAEIDRHHKASVVNLHTPEWRLGLQRWMKHGGVALATFDTLPHLPLLRHIRPDLLVAHDVPESGHAADPRSAAVATLVRNTSRVVTHTGRRMPSEQG